MYRDNKYFYIKCKSFQEMFMQIIYEVKSVLGLYIFGNIVRLTTMVGCAVLAYMSKEYMGVTYIICIIVHVYE